MHESLSLDNIKNIFFLLLSFYLSGPLMQRKDIFFRTLSNILIINLMITMLQRVNIKSNIANFFKDLQVVISPLSINIVKILAWSNL